MNAVDKMKAQVFKLFDLGEFRKAIVGDEDFIFHDDLWGDHDSTSIFLWLFDWIGENPENASNAINETKRILNDRLYETKETSNIDGSLLPIILVRSYCLAASVRKNWAIEQEFIVKLLHEYIEKFTEQETKRFNIERI